jgi:hypothetical protein
MKGTLGTIVLAVTVMAPLQAANGLLIVEKTTGITATPSTNQIQLENNRMKAESTGESGTKRVVMFDGTRKVLTMVDNDKKTYTEVTQQDAEQIGAQLSAAMDQLKKQMDMLPPERRAQMQEMMSRMGAGPATKPTYKKAGTATVGKWTCERYEGFEGDKKTSEVCTVDPKVLGFATTDFAITQQLIDFMQKIVPQMAAQAFTLGSVEQQGFPGVPVRRTYTIAGKDIVSEITEVSRQSFSDASYAVPPGYTKQAFGPLGRGRGRGF